MVTLDNISLLVMLRLCSDAHELNTFLKYNLIAKNNYLSENSQGCIYSVKVNSHTGAISRSHKNRSIRNKSPITTVQYRTFSFVARGPVLLACARDGNICLFRLLVVFPWPYINIQLNDYLYSTNLSFILQCRSRSSRILNPTVFSQISSKVA